MDIVVIFIIFILVIAAIIGLFTIGEKRRKDAGIDLFGQKKDKQD
ncbi:hypothetical protein ACFLVJ_03545 [Chloroflexota bacterium]